MIRDSLTCSRSCRASTKSRCPSSSSSSASFRTKTFKHSASKGSIKYKKQRKSFKGRRNTSKHECRPSSKNRTIPPSSRRAPKLPYHRMSSRSMHIINTSIVRHGSQGAWACRDQSKKSLRSWRSILRNSGSRLGCNAHRISKISKVSKTSAA